MGKWLKKAKFLHINFYKSNSDSRPSNNDAHYYAIHPLSSQINNTKLPVVGKHNLQLLYIKLSEMVRITF